MVTINKDEARGGVESRGHRVLRVLVISLVLLMGAWYLVETLS